MLDEQVNPRLFLKFTSVSIYKLSYFIFRESRYLQVTDQRQVNSTVSIDTHRHIVQLRQFSSAKMHYITRAQRILIGTTATHSLFP